VRDSGTTDCDPDYGYFWSSTSTCFGGDRFEYDDAWYAVLGTAVNDDGAGGMRFDTQYEGGALGESVERYPTLVDRLVSPPFPK